jgi:NAD(P)H-nitrite reductase large subunit
MSDNPHHPAHYLIVGNGAAGLSAAEVIRRRDDRGRITIITNEPYLFYSRPGIAYFILGQVSAKQIISRTEAFYREHRLDLRQGTVTGLDLSQQIAYLDGTEPMEYDVLLLATGSTAVPAPFPGADLDGVLTLDSLDDAKRVIAYGRRAKTAVVVGGGITAMELSEGLCHQKARTYLLQRGDRIWPRLFDEREAALIEQAAQHEGVRLRYQDEIEEIVGRRGKVCGVRLKSGDQLSCQVVGVAIGVRPNRQLVAGQPVAQDKGVLVNSYMQSSVPTLFAAGDLAQVHDRWTEQHHLDVLWPSAINEGRAAGYNMVEMAKGRPLRYEYQKGSPFNAALLYGVHLTVIGQVGNASREQADLSYQSRGSSNVWTAPFSSSYRSAWDRQGTQSLRIVMNNGRIVGALLIGNQELADPLRHLIETEADLSAYESDLIHSGDQLPQRLAHLWRSY